MLLKQSKGLRQDLVVPYARIVGSKRLKGAPYAEANNSLLLVEEKRKSVNDLVLPGVGIIRKYQAKRHVDDGHLNSQLHAEATAKVTEFAKERLRQANRRVGLRLPAQEDLLETEGQLRERIYWPEVDSVLQLRSGNQPVVTHHQSGNTALPRHERQLCIGIAGRQGCQTDSSGTDARNAGAP